MNTKSIKNSCIALVAAVCLVSAMPGEQPITKNGKQVIINTTTIAADIKGYNGPTPLKIYITNNKIDKIEALPNQETPKYFFKVKKQMLGQWDGMAVSEAAKAKVDAVTGATMSSECLNKTVQRGLEYYKKNK